jgi:hypothetical protein
LRDWKSKLIAATLLLSFAGGAYGLTGSNLPEGLKKVGEKKETVTYYTYTIRRDGKEADFRIIKVGNTYYGLPMKLVNGQFQRVEPKVYLVPIKADFLKDAVKKLQEAGYKSFTVKGSGKGHLYIVFDSMCPFCMRAAQSGKLEELKKKYAEITFLPLVVHGDVSEKGLVCIYNKAKKEGIEKAIKEVFGWKKDKSWKEYADKLSSCGKKDKTIEEVSNLLVKNRVNGTPTFFLEVDGKVYKNVGIPDFSKRK